MNLNPDILKVHQDMIPMYEMVDRATGRSTELVLRGLAQALANPGCRVLVMDHHLSSTRSTAAAAKHLLHLAQGLVACFAKSWFSLHTLTHDGGNYLCIVNTHIQPLQKPKTEVYVP